LLFDQLASEIVDCWDVGAELHQNVRELGQVGEILLLFVAQLHELVQVLADLQGHFVVGLGLLLALGLFGLFSSVDHLNRYSLNLKQGKISL
jgi:hypothetical protein